MSQKHIERVRQPLSLAVHLSTVPGVGPQKMQLYPSKGTPQQLLKGTLSRGHAKPF